MKKQLALLYFIFMAISGIANATTINASLKELGKNLPNNQPELEYHIYDDQELEIAENREFLNKKITDLVFKYGNYKAEKKELKIAIPAGLLLLIPSSLLLYSGHKNGNILSQLLGAGLITTLTVLELLYVYHFRKITKKMNFCTKEMKILSNKLANCSTSEG